MAIDRVNLNGFTASEVEELIRVFDHACEYLMRDHAGAHDVAHTIVTHAQMNGCDDPGRLFEHVVTTFNENA